MERITWPQLAHRYCERQEQTPAGLHEILKRQRDRMNPDGWALLECQVLDSSSLGNLTIIAFGPANTFQEPPTRPVSIGGLASTMSSCVGVLMVEDFPEEVSEDA